MMSDQIGALYIGHCADGYTTKHTVDQLQALVAAGRDCDGCSREFGVLIEVQNTHLLRHFMLKMIVLPRQARDRHRESTQKEVRIFAYQGTADVYGAHAYNMGNSAPYSRWGHFLPGKVGSESVEIFPELYRYTFPEHVQRTSSFLQRNTSFWLGLRGEYLFPAIEASRDVVYSGADNASHFGGGINCFIVKTIVLPRQARDKRWKG